MKRFNLLTLAASLTVLFGVASDARDCHAQAGLRETLDAMDRNQNGRLEPDEIAPLARPYLERVAESRRMDMDRPYEISKWQEAARIYYALVNGVAGMTVRPDLESTVKSFQPGDDDVLVPEFGLAEMKFPYTLDDLEEADETLGRYDRNDDGYIDRVEARRGKWTHRDPFEEDYNFDGRLSRLELGQRYARRRLLDGQSDELKQKAKRVGNGIRSSDTGSDGRDDSRWWRRGGSQYYLTASIMGRFDTNKNGRLEPAESAAIGIPVGRIDADRDGELSRDEVHAYMSELQDEAGDETLGIPAWFFQRDANRDEQITMAEYTDEWSDELVQQFASLDANQDGVLTKVEVTGSAAVTGGTFANTDATILAPRKTVISEIVIDEPVIIADLDVQISITHSHTSYLDAFLVGPDGDRIELFTSVGGTDDHFEQTIFDDQAELPIVKARAPFEGRFMPEALIKKQPSLWSFNGRSAKGVWQLVIAGSRSERFGMLHRWSLIIKPQDSLEPNVVISGEVDALEVDSIDLNSIDVERGSVGD